MPKPPLTKEDAILEYHIIETMIAGLHEWRPDLSWPQSYSDMQACVRGLLKMFEITRRPLIAQLRIECHTCDGLGHMVTKAEGNYRESMICGTCKGKGWISE